MIYTFYSFKGGVGRSMALANLAEWFYRQGLRVVMIDWDLEAPGLESFFFGAEAQAEIGYAVRGALRLTDPQATADWLRALLGERGLFPGEGDPERLAQFLRAAGRLPDGPGALEDLHQLLNEAGLPDLETVRKQVGVIDLLMAYKRQFPALVAAALPRAAAGKAPNSDGPAAGLPAVRALLKSALPPLSASLFLVRKAQASPGGALWLLPAGARSPDRDQAYAQQVQSFDWIDFYTSYQGMAYFEWLREQLLELADVVLIDSRTGVTEMGGVCTRQLADVVVSFCAPNEQNLAGTRLMDDSFRSPNTQTARAEAQRGPVEVVVVPARVDMTGEIDDLNRFERSFKEAMDDPPQAFAGVRTSFWGLKIPYVTKYSYREKLVIGRPDRSEAIEEAYKTLAGHLALLAPEGSAARSRCAPEVRRLFGTALPRVWIAYSPGDGAADAGRLRSRLTKAGLSVWGDLPPGTGDAWQQVAGILDQVEHLVVVLTSEAGQSEAVRRQVRHARQQGKSVSVVSWGPASTPSWTRGVPVFDLEGEGEGDWERLVRRLGAPGGTVRVPFMAPSLPEPVVARRDTWLETVQSSNLTLWGAAGSGKSVLAAQICCDDRIRDYFEDGILWATLGPQPDLVKELARLYAALTGENPSFSNRDQGADRLAAALASRRCLLVLDDVWDVPSLSHFIRGAQRCVYLITTRDLNVATFRSSWPRLQVGEMTAAEASQLLSAYVGPPRAGEVAVAGLAERLGRWPLVLALAGAALRKRAAVGDTPDKAWDYITQLAEQRGVAAFDQVPAGERNQSFAKSLSLSLGRLKDGERTWYYRLARFPAGDISLGDAAAPAFLSPAEVRQLAHLSPAEAGQLAQRLADLSLLLLDPTAQTIRLQPALRWYILDQNLSGTRHGVAVARPAVNEDVARAKRILSGEVASPADMLALARRLRAGQALGYARRILALARSNPEAARDHALRVKLAQQHALCVSRDPDLLAGERHDLALEILQQGEDLATTRNQETLGIAGGIWKRKWEVDGQQGRLDQSLAYYLRGYREGAEGDLGYTAINAAFLLDLLAAQEGQGAKVADASSGSAAARRQEARRIRETILATLPALATRPGRESLEKDWWFLVTVAEAAFGLRKYEEASEWLRAASALRPADWEYETTARQLAAIARLQGDERGPAEGGEEAPAWKVLRDFLGNDAAALRSTAAGKTGLALSGGGFRASLFHIGVLARLAELDVLRSVEVLSCVSGGSVIGAHYYLEVRHLLQTKRDEDITREDYLAIVQRIERDFLAGVQQNVRMQVASGLPGGLRMTFQPGYSRTTRAGELFETELFARVPDGEGGRPRLMRQLTITPQGAPADFHPKYHNWRRRAKVPVLVLNATTLNTGHNWQFTATWMGEPPSGVDPEVDGNERLRRLYYHDAPPSHRYLRLGHAVAASACVPGLFEPLVLAGLYPERTVRLVDGGAQDNQGIGGLLDEDCAVLLVSDASGQMQAQGDPDAGFVGVLKRSDHVLQARVRASQFQALEARRRGGLLRGLLFVHLKKDLDVRPVDWVNCQDPGEAVSGRQLQPLTSYGITKEVQGRLAAIRTDLDSFCDQEAYALMLSGYQMTAHEFPRRIRGFPAEVALTPWRFLAVRRPMAGGAGFEEANARLKRVLDAGSHQAFKLFRLCALVWPLTVLGFIALAAFVLTCGVAAEGYPSTGQGFQTAILLLGIGAVGTALLLGCAAAWHATLTERIRTGILSLTVCALCGLYAFAFLLATGGLDPPWFTAAKDSLILGLAAHMIIWLTILIGLFATGPRARLAGARAKGQGSFARELLLVVVLYGLIGGWVVYVDVGRRVSLPGGPGETPLWLALLVALRSFIVFMGLVFVASFVLALLVTWFFGRPRKSPAEILIGLALTLFGCFAAAVHLLVFDPLYLSLGRLEPANESSQPGSAGQAAGPGHD
jgi:predicted acylesterase/phospholipase RssA